MQNKYRSSRGTVTYTRRVEKPQLRARELKCSSAVNLNGLTLQSNSDRAPLDLSQLAKLPIEVTRPLWSHQFGKTYWRELCGGLTRWNINNKHLVSCPSKVILFVLPLLLAPSGQITGSYRYPGTRAPLRSLV